jgi:protein-tyrosine-phosphatase
MMSEVYNVLFLCTGNSARSIMAEAIMNREGMGRFRGFSAGSHPKGEVHANTLDLLNRLNHDVSAARSKSWDYWPGQPMTAHWGLADPAAAQGSEAEIRLAFSDAYRMLRNRISIFVSLPLKSLDRLSLQTKLDEIGKNQESAETG